MKKDSIVAHKRLCANHGVKAICVISKFYLCVSFGNIIKIINISNINILLEYVVSSSGNVYGLLYKTCKVDNNSKIETGILVAYCVHKIYFYSLEINGDDCSLKLISKYCINKWVLRAKFLPCYNLEKELNTNENTEKGETNKQTNQKEHLVAFCLSNGSVIFVNVCKGICFYKFKFKGIHLLYSADIYIEKKKNKCKFLVAGGTPFSNILLWYFKIRNIQKIKKIYQKKNKKKVISLTHVQEIKGHRGVIFKVKFFKKCKYISSVSDDREGRIWKIVNQKNLMKHKMMNDSIEDKSLITNKKNKISRKIQLVYKCINILSGHGARLWDIDMCWFNKKLFFITCSEDGSCNLYEDNNNNKYLGFSNFNRSTIRCVRFHSTWGLIIAGCDNGTLYVRFIPINSFGNDSENKKSEIRSYHQPKFLPFNVSKEEQKENNNVQMHDYIDRGSKGNDIVSKHNSNNNCAEVVLQEISVNEDSLMFMSNCMNKKMKKNDWIRSIHHINVSNFLICTNLGCLYILQLNAEKKKMQVSLIYEEEKKEHLTTCLSFWGNEYICLGFSNGVCCFLFLKMIRKGNDINKNVYKTTYAYFNCFSHRVSAMCLLYLSKKCYDYIIKYKKRNNVLDVLNVYIKKEKRKSTGGADMILLDENEYSYNSCFYKVYYKHGEDENIKVDQYFNNDPLSSNESTQIDKTFLLCNIDYAGSVKMFLIKNEYEDIKTEMIFETEIDVKNKKSRIISMNYLMRQKKKKVGILFFIGDEYGFIFIIYVKMPICLKANKEIEYCHKEIHLKSTDKIRAHGNRKVFDIQFIGNYIYSCGKNGNIIKYQLFKNKDRIYTLHMLCLIKIAYYSSIYKIIPMWRNSCDYLNERKIEQQTCNDNFPITNSKDNSNNNNNNNNRTYDIFVCCFKEKKFVLYDLKNKVEYMSVDCGGFRRPLSIDINFDKNSIKTFSFCFCKEKNIYFNFKKLSDNCNEGFVIPYQKTYINAGFHNKNVSFFMWIKKRYLCSCSEDGTIKVVHYVNKKRIYNLKDKETNNTHSTNNTYKNAQIKESFVLNKKIITNYLYEKKFHFKKSRKKQTGNILDHQMNIIQNVYNHSEPIFYMAFLKNFFFFSKKLKLLVSVGAKNSANVFYVFHDIHCAPVLYHIEKVKTRIFSSSIRLLCVQGTYDVLMNKHNKCMVKVNICIGASIGYIFNYTGIYEFSLFQNIVLPNIIKPASLVSSYNLHSTIWSMYLKLDTSSAVIENLLSKCDGQIETENKKQKKKCEKEQKEHTSFTGNDFVAEDGENKCIPQENYLFFIKKEKKSDEKLCRQFFFCGLGSGILQIRYCCMNNGKEPIDALHNYDKENKTEEMKMILLKKIQIHQNGINKIYVKKKKNLFHVFTCGDDQSINILILKMKNKNNEMHIYVLQSSIFYNAHFSSVISLVIMSSFLFTVSWDQYIYIWKIKKIANNEKYETNKKIWSIEKRGQIKIAVYDVCCLSAFKYRRQNKSDTQISDYEKKKNKHHFSKFDLGVSGANGSLELFRIKLIE